jgi:hypothetical protein
MLYVNAAFRPPNAVSSSPTRETAPPICQIGKEVRGDAIRSESSLRLLTVSRTSSP